MKIHVEIDPSVNEPEITIKCNAIDEHILEIQKKLSSIEAQKDSLIFYKDETEYYLPIRKILFFETTESGISAHTQDEEFTVKYKLYELEQLLPDIFIRVSKSTILNITMVYSITRNITASSKVEFKNTYKNVYVSRNYYKALKYALSPKVTK